jgi:transposase
VALLNPIRTRRFADADLARAKTDAIDALGIARYAAQKKPSPTKLPEPATEQIREIVRHRDRLVQRRDDETRRLHRLVDLCFPELRRHVKELDSFKAMAILREYPTSTILAHVQPKRLARLVYDGRHKVGDELARAIIDSAKVSVGRHDGPAYHIQVRHLFDEIELLKRQIAELDHDLAATLEQHEIAKLLTTIDGIGPNTALRLVAEIDFDAFASARELASYVGVVPGTKLSGKSKRVRFALAPFGKARVRKSLWMPTLVAVHKNPWLRAYYQRLRANGKVAKVALIASMRKLLGAIFSVAKNRRAFVPIVADVTT